MQTKFLYKLFLRLVYSYWYTAIYVFSESRERGKSISEVNAKGAPRMTEEPLCSLFYSHQIGRGRVTCCLPQASWRCRLGEPYD